MSFAKSFYKTALFSILYGNSLFADPTVFDAVLKKSNKVIEQRNKKKQEIEEIKKQYSDPLILQALQDVETRMGTPFEVKLVHNAYYTSSGFKKKESRGFDTPTKCYSKQLVYRPIDWSILNHPELYKSLIKLEKKVRDFLATDED